MFGLRGWRGSSSEAHQFNKGFTSMVQGFSHHSKTCYMQSAGSYLHEGSYLKSKIRTCNN